MQFEGARKSKKKKKVEQHRGKRRGEKNETKGRYKEGLGGVLLRAIKEEEEEEEEEKERKEGSRISILRLL